MEEQGVAGQAAPGEESAAPAGWYPDPLSVSERRYWDGERWTDHLHSQGTEQAAAAAGRDRPRLAVILGAVALALSPFLTWANVVLLGSLNLFQLAEAAGDSTGVIWAFVLIGAASAFGAWKAKSRRAVPLIGLLVGFLVGAVAILVFIGMINGVREADGLATVSYGPWVAILGCAAMVVGGLMSKRAPRQEPRPPS